MASCSVCLDTGHVCERHPERPWEGLTAAADGGCTCAAAGMPCPACCSPIPEDGTHSIVRRWRRASAEAVRRERFDRMRALIEARQ